MEGCSTLGFPWKWMIYGTTWGTKSLLWSWRLVTRLPNSAVAASLSSSVEPPSSHISGLVLTGAFLFFSPESSISACLLTACLAFWVAVRVWYAYHSSTSSFSGLLCRLLSSNPSVAVLGHYIPFSWCQVATHPSASSAWPIQQNTASSHFVPAPSMLTHHPTTLPDTSHTCSFLFSGHPSLSPHAPTPVLSAFYSKTESTGVKASMFSPGGSKIILLVGQMIF